MGKYRYVIAMVVLITATMLGCAQKQEYTPESFTTHYMVYVENSSGDIQLFSEREPICNETRCSISGGFYVVSNTRGIYAYGGKAKFKGTPDSVHGLDINWIELLGEMGDRPTPTPAIPNALPL